MIHESHYCRSVAEARAEFPNAAIIRRIGDRTIVFDTAADAWMHETRIVPVVEEGQ